MRGLLGTPGEGNDAGGVSISEHEKIEGIIMHSTSGHITRSGGLCAKVIGLSCSAHYWSGATACCCSLVNCPQSRVK